MIISDVQYYSFFSVKQYYSIVLFLSIIVFRGLKRENWPPSIDIDFFPQIIFITHPDYYYLKFCGDCLDLGSTGPHNCTMEPLGDHHIQLYLLLQIINNLGNAANQVLLLSAHLSKTNPLLLNATLYMQEH